jgi:ADP-ribose pyrophosphatase
VTEQVIVIASGKHLRLVKRGSWEFAERPGVSGVVAIVAVRDDGRLVLTEQHRPPVEKRVIDLVAGLAGDIEGQRLEPLESAAEREMLEEIGYRASSLTLLASGPPSPGMSTEVVTFYLARGLVKVAPGGGEGTHEAITVHEIELSNIDAWLAEKERGGAMIDLKVYAGLYLASRSLSSSARRGSQRA